KPVTAGEWKVYRDFERQIINCGIPTVGGHTDRRIDRYEYVRRDEVEMLVREQIDAVLRARGIDARAEAVSRSAEQSAVWRRRSLMDTVEEVVQRQLEQLDVSAVPPPAQMRRKVQEEEAATSRQAARPQAAEEGLHDEPDVGERPSTPPPVRPVTFAGEDVPRHLLYTYFDDECYEGGSHVPSVFRKQPKYDYMFHHELDTFDRNYYMESFTIPATQREG
ncbi:unnamed protein product, partial [Strongylus vulgaris]